MKHWLGNETISNLVCHHDCDVVGSSKLSQMRTGLYQLCAALGHGVGATLALATSVEFSTVISRD